MKAQLWATALTVGVLSAAALPGCKTEAFCFDDCASDSDAGVGGAGAAGSGGVGGSIDTDSGAGTGGGGTGGATDACSETNAGTEICDGVDNDCNGKVDDLADWRTVQACGSCELRCDACPSDGTPCEIPQFVADPTCVPPSVLDGTTRGSCDWTTCAPDFWDVDGNKANGCEYFCQENPNGTNTVDIGGTFPGQNKGCGFDDDCDGEIDEDVDLCTDVNNCGTCGRQCVLPNATASCVTTRTGTEPCTGGPTGNTQCAVAQCDAGFHDVDGSPTNGCEYECTVTNGGVEICDGLDNDCDRLIDNADPSLEDSEVGDTCQGGTEGVCADTANAGVKKCIGDTVECCDVGSNNIASTNPNLPPTGLRNGLCRATTGTRVVFPGDRLESCNNLDDDCDGTKDDSPVDEGGTCGSSVGRCQAGTRVCDSANRPTCTGPNDCLRCDNAVTPTTETCNGQDDDCDGVIDGTIPTTAPPVVCTTDGNCASGQVCLPRTTSTDRVCAQPTNDVGPTFVCDAPDSAHPPAGTPVICTAGTLQCIAGQKTCVGSVTRSTSTPDSCGKDENCDGVLTGQPDLQTSLGNCGACGNNCLAIAPAGHGQWACNAGQCQRTGCEPGFINCDGNANDCERACTFLSAQETCNGVDDNCNCQIDENVVPPSPAQVCGVGAGATDPNCTTNVTVTCQDGSFSCTFPAGYCTGAAPNYCSSTQDVCDNKDNNCNGTVDDNFKRPVLTTGAVGDPCSTPASEGACRGFGTFVCNSTQDGTTCNAVKDNTKVSAELCDGLDNDCDGSIDEPFTDKGTNTTFWVKPAVTQVASSLWIYQYEASRAGATATNPGSGNGFQTSAPAGSTLDQTVACSAPGVVPWFNVTPQEVEQTCDARGGRICDLTDWRTACRATVPCTWGYAPRASCTLPGTYDSGNQRICNIGPFDFDGNPLTGIQDGLLPTASSSLFNCWADWSGLQSNTTATSRIFDITGNLREITKSGTLYTLMGGAYNTQSEDGATCDFTFFTVNETYKLFDVGFRCCFDQNPGL